MHTPRLLPYPLAALILLVSIAWSVLACAGDAANGSDPIRSLASRTDSRRYDVAFWAEQQHRSTSTWLAAWKYCRERDERQFPNCASIRLVGWIEAPPPPPIERRGFLLEP